MTVLVGAALLTSLLLSACSAPSSRSSNAVPSVPETVVATPTNPSDDIAFVRNDHVWRIHPDGTGAVQLTFDEAVDYSPSWSPDRTKIAFVRSKGEGSVLGIVPSAGGPVQTWETGSFITGLSFSPDGARIAMADLEGSNEAHVRVRIFDLASGTTTLVVQTTSPTDLYWHVSWSPDGRRILVGEGVQSDDGNRTRLVDIANKRMGYLLTPDAIESRWAPDGAWFVVSQAAQGYTAIAIADFNGRITHVLVRGGGWDHTDTAVSSGSYSSDGLRVAFQQGDFIWTIGADGRGKRKVTKGEQPVWSSR